MERVRSLVDLLLTRLVKGDLTGFIQLSSALVSPLEGRPYVEYEYESALFVGDLHGDYESLSSAARQDVEAVVFLGDYVDRGPNSLEVLLGVLALKAGDPGRVVVLRGNHEDPVVNEGYGFRAELEEKLGRYGDAFFDHLALPSYTRMPVVAKIKAGGITVLALHGGPTPSLTPQKARAIPLQTRPRDKTLVDVLWSDPREGLEGVKPSPRGAGKLYGRDVVEKALEAFKADVLIRAHEPVDGYKEMFDGKLYTVFSSRHYRIQPAALLVTSRKIKPVKL